MSTQEEAAVLRAAACLVACFAAHDTAGYFAAFVPEASFIFHNMAEVLPSRAAYEALWRRWEREDGFRVLACRSFEQAVKMIDEIAIFTHRVETRVAFGTDEQQSAERETIIFHRQPGGEWLAVHEHLSPYNFS
jgi:ketosteroid isomerase-like protein